MAACDFAPVLYFPSLCDLLHNVLVCTGATSNNAGILRPLPRIGWLGAAADIFLCSAMASLAQGSQHAPGLTQAEVAGAAGVPTDQSPGSLERGAVAFTMLPSFSLLRSAPV